MLKYRKNPRNNKKRGVDRDTDYGNIKSELTQNIKFFYSPGLLLRSIATGGNYKNYLKNSETDIMIVQIPKSQLKKDVSFSSINNVITQDNGGNLYLNPEYVKYSARVNSAYCRVLILLKA